MKRYLLQSAGIGLFIFAFLAIIKPFNIDHLGNKALFHAFSYGMLTFTICFIYDLFIQFILKIDREKNTWKFWKWLLVTLGLVLCIAIGNFFLVRFLHQDFNFQISSLFNMIGYTMTLAFFPVIFLGTLQLYKNITRNVSIANDIKIHSKEQNDVELSFKNKEGFHNLLLNQFLFAEAMQNYIALYKCIDQVVTKDVHRMTMTNLLSQIENNGIKRCHRSYLINPQKIISVSGNAQGLKLKLENIEMEVPVSRKYIPIIKSLI